MTVYSSRERRALTLVEVVMSVVLIALLAVFFFRIFKFQSLSWYTVEKLDVLQHLRVAERQISAEVERATAILYPPCTATNETYHRLVFAGAENDIQVVYWTPEGAIALQGLDGKPRVLAERIESFIVRHPLAGQICCELTARDGKERTVVSVGIAGFASNGFGGE